MSVQSEINRITAAKNAIGTAIAGKGVAVPSGTLIDGMAALIANIEQGGSGEDISAETAEYTSLLTDLETAIDALPDAGSGGSGAVETCSVRFYNTDGGIWLHGYVYTTVSSDGIITHNYWFNPDGGIATFKTFDITIDNVMSNSVFTVIATSRYDSRPTETTTNCTKLSNIGASGNSEAISVITPGNGEIATIQLYDDD